MTTEKINKLRELAERGVGGEKENAKAILTKIGVDWKKPKLDFNDAVKKTFGGNIVKSYTIQVLGSSDVLLLQNLLNRLTKNVDIQLGYAGVMNFKCTPTEYQDLMRIYNKHRSHFNNQMYKESNKYINQYMAS